MFPLVLLKFFGDDRVFPIEGRYGEDAIETIVAPVEEGFRGIGNLAVGTQVRTATVVVDTNRVNHQGLSQGLACTLVMELDGGNRILLPDVCQEGLPVVNAIEFLLRNDLIDMDEKAVVALESAGKGVGDRR